MRSKDSKKLIFEDELTKHKVMKKMLKDLEEQASKDGGESAMSGLLMSKEETEKRMKDHEGYNRALKGVSPLDKGVLDEIEMSTFSKMKLEDIVEEE